MGVLPSSLKLPGMSATDLLLLLLAVVAAAPLTGASKLYYEPPPPPPPSQPLTMQPPRGLFIVIFATLTILIVIAFSSLVVQLCCNRHMLPRPRFLHWSIPDSMLGLDPAVIDSFPTFVYSDVKKHDPFGTTECAVCLSDFADLDRLRLLPACSHAFHLGCIDMWLASHTTCPVCRVPLDQGAVAEDAARPPETAADQAADVEEAWTAEERERFTLRLPAPEIERCRSSVGRAEGCSEKGSGRMRLVGKAMSERWAFLAKVATPFDGPRRWSGEGTSRGPEELRPPSGS